MKRTRASAVLFGAGIGVLAAAWPAVDARGRSAHDSGIAAEPPAAAAARELAVGEPREASKSAETRREAVGGSSESAARSESSSVETSRDRPVVVAGVVVDSRGAPVSGVGLEARSEERIERCRTSADGTFELRGETDAARIEIAVDAADLAPCDVGATIPTTGLVVELRDGGRISGRLLVPRDVDPTTFTFAASFPARHDRDRWSRVEADGGFELKGLAEDFHLLEVRVGACSDVIRLGGGRIANGERVDLGELDLRGRVFARRVEVVDELGIPIAGATVARGFDLEPPPLTDASGSVVLATATSALDLVVEAPGLRPESIRCEGDVRVVLRPGIPVELIVAGRAPELPDGFELQLELRDWPRGCTFAGFRPSVGLWRGTPRRADRVPIEVPKPGRYRLYAAALRSSDERASGSRPVACKGLDIPAEGLAAAIPIELDDALVRELVREIENGRR